VYFKNERYINTLTFTGDDNESDSDGSVDVLVCSAGVGRTGVLIGMLTAWCYIKAVVAVDMLAVVRQMRDQRPVLIQTPVSLASRLRANIRAYTCTIQYNSVYLTCSKKLMCSQRSLRCGTNRKI